MKTTTLEKCLEFPLSGRPLIKGYYTSDDGVISGYGSAGRSFVEAYEKADREYKVSVADWVKALRKLGVKAAHPDDGWHDRVAHSIGFCYPYFDDGVEKGSMIALGNPGRFVVVTADYKSGWLSSRWHYKSSIY